MKIETLNAKEQARIEGLVPLTFDDLWNAEPYSKFVMQNKGEVDVIEKMVNRPKHPNWGESKEANPQMFFVKSFDNRFLVVNENHFEKWKFYKHEKDLRLLLRFDYHVKEAIRKATHYREILNERTS